MAVTPEDIERVLATLKVEQYQWRTLGGIMNDTDLTVDTVLEALGAAGDTVVRLPSGGADGRDLFTTRERLRADASPLARVVAAMRNRAV